MNGRLPKLTNFILPTGSINIARAVCRRVERKLVSVIKDYEHTHINDNAMIFINRLSDYLFQLSRYAHFLTNKKEVIYHKSEILTLIDNFEDMNYKMSLVELVDNNYTDKNTVHSYLATYEKLFSKKKETAKNVLEVGIHFGGSIKLWHDYFVNSTVYGIEYNDVWQEYYEKSGIINNERIKLHNNTDAYNPVFVNNTLKNIKFDMVLDDGPHSIDSFVSFIRLYSELLADDGILVIEDIQHPEWLRILSEAVPDNLKAYIEIYDLRQNKNRYDDILFVINKSRQFI
jgi:cephalosporin hydroxylase